MLRIQRFDILTAANEWETISELTPLSKRHNISWTGVERIVCRFVHKRSHTNCYEVIFILCILATNWRCWLASQPCAVLVSFFCIRFMLGAAVILASNSLTAGVFRARMLFISDFRIRFVHKIRTQKQSISTIPTATTLLCIITRKRNRNRHRATEK